MAYSEPTGNEFLKLLSLSLYMCMNIIRPVDISRISNKSHLIKYTNRKEENHLITCKKSQVNKKEEEKKMFFFVLIIKGDKYSTKKHTHRQNNIFPLTRSLLLDNKLKM